MVIGYADLRKRLEAEGKQVIVLPQLQEVRFIAFLICSVADLMLVQWPSLRYRIGTLQRSGTSGT